MNTKYLFILGAQRSGSTLLNLVLGSHSQATAIGEGWKLNAAVVDNKECTCGQQFRDCPFWSAVAIAMEKEMGWNPMASPGAQVLHRHDIRKLASFFLIAAEKAVGQLGARPLSRRILSMVRQTSTMKSVVKSSFSLLDACLQVSDAALAVDSGKDAFRVDALYRERPNESKVLFLVRDGRGVSASRLGKGRNPTTPNRFSMKSAASQWKKENQQSLAVVEQLPEDAWIIQRYEEFCESPEQVLRHICSFAGVEYEPQMQAFTTQTHHNLIGNRMRFSREGQIKLDDAWRDNLSEEELKTFDRVAGDLNRQFGFTPTSY